MRSFIYIFLAVSLHALGKDLGMFSNSSCWFYPGRDIDNDIYADSVLWSVAGGDEGIVKVSVDGREYARVKRYLWLYDVDSKDGVPAARRVNFYNPEVLLREEGGKVYARKDQYVEVMNVIYGVGDESLFMEECNDGEVLLYDFTLGEGDRYPCCGNVYVEKVSELVTNDGLSRKCMTLTNGAVIVEGIGCVNSIGEFYGYQNVPVLNVGERGCLVEYGYWGFDGETYTVVYQDGLISAALHVSNLKDAPLPSMVYDLQGRKVQSPQRGGLYIQGGRMFVCR